MTTAPKRVAVTGGGSAGHVVPALPIMRALLDAGCAVDFIGSTSTLEQRLVAPLGVPYHGIRTGKLRRYLSVENVIDCFRVPFGILQAWRLLRRLRPAVVFSKGGFVAFPVVVGAWLRRIPVVAHESDMTPGLANRLSAPFLDALCVNFEATAARVSSRRKLNVVVTGTPLRPALLNGDANLGWQRIGVSAERPALLVVGGSLGAERLNQVVREALPTLLESYTVVHVCGAGKRDSTFADMRGYVQLEYVDEGWGDIIAAVDLVVSRAGANAIYEWLALRKPHLLVPLPRTASRGDQIENAAFAERAGFSQVLAEDELNAKTLAAAVAKLAVDASQYRTRLLDFAVPDTTALVVRELERAAGCALVETRTG